MSHRSTTALLAPKTFAGFVTIAEGTLPGRMKRALWIDCTALRVIACIETPEVIESSHARVRIV